MAPRLKNYIIYGSPVLAVVCLLVVLHSISPLDFGPAGILLVFILIYFVTVSVVFAIFHALVTILLRLRHSKPLQSRKLRLAYYVITIVSLAPIFLLALNSIGQLELKDFILVALLLGVACFYVLRRFGR